MDRHGQTQVRALIHMDNTWTLMDINVHLQDLKWTHVHLCLPLGHGSGYEPLRAVDLLDFVLLEECVPGQVER